MAADWRGWRLIVVNGERFRWRCLFGCSCGYCAAAWRRVLIRSEVSPSRLLTVSVGWGNFGLILPSNVAEWIAHAQAHRWPDERRLLELQLTNRPGVPHVVVVEEPASV